MSAPGRPDVGPRVAADDVRRLLRRHATTVTVVTALCAGRPVGFTATSFTSVSLRPPLFSFCQDRGSSSWPAVTAAPHVAVHLLGADQADLARVFATRGADRFAPTGWRPGPFGLPVLDGVLAWLVGRVTHRIAAGDHTIVLAEPVAADCGDGSPLLYHDGRYTGLSSRRDP
ncbi:flavin-dependent reductase [Asanoa ishikariensis]|uniref:NADH-FMN oxidoreductase RutF, flavin reductase (DIM6/NTAB) family n=1 Tax=Asanoa ishikariensis TaxID=137265 RepID=A0A1H3TAK7_9ACTN|nr:flavin reductase family protein [Asanoa ishikariensis]GIF62819.1 flavin-dependent reductase [Asanoa ishikariensis]SDZ46898.1 NADH-FMN oxidoreductase RutF, flavin reductase (DIM6/NTAB) family [Asanoa ishikariensis]